MVLRGSLAITLAGVAIGLLVAFFATRLLQSMLFGVEPRDPATFAGAIAGIAIVSLAASLLPALRAASVDPISSRAWPSRRWASASPGDKSIAFR